MIMKKNDFKKMTAVEREEYARRQVQLLVRILVEYILKDEFEGLSYWRRDVKNWVSVYKNMVKMKGHTEIDTIFLIH